MYCVLRTVRDWLCEHQKMHSDVDFRHLMNSLMENSMDYVQC